MKLRIRLMTRLADLVVGRPLLVLLVSALVLGAGVDRCRRLEFRASKVDFLPPDDPSVESYQRLVDELGALSAILMLVEGPPADIRRFADEAAPALRGLKDWVRGLTHRLDVDQYLALGLQLAPPDEIRATVDDVTGITPLLQHLTGDPGIASFVEHVASEMGDDTRVAPEAPEMREDLAFIDEALSAVEHELSPAGGAGGPVFPQLKDRHSRMKQLAVDERGYLSPPGDGVLLMVLDTTRFLNRDDITEAFLIDLHHVVDPLLAKYPAVRLGLAGSPIRDLEEEDTIDADLGRTSCAAAVGIFILSLMAFGGLVPSFLILAVLLVSVALSGALTQMIYGHLNLVSAVFVAILLGLGHDFGNYLIILSREWVPARGTLGIRDAVVVVGSSTLTAALTTTAAFYSLLLHEFGAFRELGVIAGTGVMVAYACMLTVLPALLSLYVRHTSAWQGTGEAKPAAFPISRFLVACLERPRAMAALCLVTFVTILPFTTGNPFQFDITQLMATGGDTVRNEEILRRRFGISTDFNVVTARTLDEVHRQTERLEGAGSVSRVDSLAHYVPRDLAAKRPLLAELREVVETIPVATAAVDAAPTSVPRMTGALRTLAVALENPRSLARMDEDTVTLDAVEKLDARVSRVLALAEREGVPAATFAVLDRRVTAEIAEFVRFLRVAATREPYTLETLPPELQRRFVGKTGTLVTYATPAQDLSSEENAARFHDETRGIQETVTGIPVITYRVMSRIKSGWIEAASWSLIGITLMILVDFWSLKLALFSLIPLVYGMAMMAGLLTLAGVRWNVLSSVAIPVFVGIGVDYGANLLHRYLLEKDLPLALRSTGRAIFYSCAATCVGFGSLLFAHHRGLQSFGLALFLGSLLSMVAALVFLPAVLRLIRFDGLTPGDGGRS